MVKRLKHESWEGIIDTGSERLTLKNKEVSSRYEAIGLGEEWGKEHGQMKPRWRLQTDVEKEIVWTIVSARQSEKERNGTKHKSTLLFHPTRYWNYRWDQHADFQLCRVYVLKCHSEERQVGTKPTPKPKCCNWHLLREGRQVLSNGRH